MIILGIVVLILGLWGFGYMFLALPFVLAEALHRALHNKPALTLKEAVTLSFMEERSNR